MAKKRFLLLILSFLLSVCCIACGNGAEPTGCPAGEIEQPQVMVDGQVYYYRATGFDEPLPDGYEYAGCVDKVDNEAAPSQDFSGCRLEKGQDIYTNPEIHDVIYLRYDSGFARFSLS